MGAHQPFQPLPPEGQHAYGSEELAPSPLKVGDALPARLDAHQMQQIFGLGKSAFYNALRRHRFDSFELLPKIGARAWSGAAVSRYLDRHESRPVFGRRSVR